VAGEAWQPGTGSTLQWDSFFNQAMTATPFADYQWRADNGCDVELAMLTSDFFEDPIVDWLGWDIQV